MSATTGVPFRERGGRVRGLLDLMTGCYPAYLFGGPVGRQIPVFHLHEVTQAGFEPCCQFLAENAYRTVTTDEIARFVIDGVWPGPRSIALTFDDARASLWTVAAPLLRKYGLKATTFAIPGRIPNAWRLRPTIESEDPAARAAAETADASDVPFVTWPELKALHVTGLIDVQSHTMNHASIFCSDRPVDFVTPAFAREHILDRPLVSAPREPIRYLAPSDLGAPIFVRRSRMTDARRFLLAADALARCTTHVAEAGGAAFFERPTWRAELEALLPPGTGTFEDDEARQRAIEEELDRSRSALDAQLGAGIVKHVAMPWGVAGSITRKALERGGYQTAFAEDLFRRRGVRAGDDPFGLMRLNGKFLRCLPGKGREHFFKAF